MLKYRLIAESIEELEAAVNAAIAEGWQPLGGPSMLANTRKHPAGVSGVQAMVRSETNEAEQQAGQMLNDIRSLTASRKPDQPQRV